MKTSLATIVLSVMFSGLPALAQPKAPLIPNKELVPNVTLRLDLIRSRKKVSITLPAPGSPKTPVTKVPKIGFRATVSGYYPESAAPSGGTIVIEGAHLTSTAVNASRNLYFGTMRLEQIVATDGMCVYQLPEVTATQTGDLKLDDETLGGINSVSVATGYRVMPRTLLPVEASIVTGDQGTNLVAHGQSALVVHLKNVPGSVIAMTNGSPFFANTANATDMGPFDDVKTQWRGNVEVFEVSGNVRTAHILYQASGEVGTRIQGVEFYGSEFVLVLVGKSVIQPTSTTLSIASVRYTRNPPPNGGEVLNTTGFSGARVTLPAWSATSDYVVENTSDLNARLNWSFEEALGVVTGKSDMALVGGRKIDVGHVNIGGDAAFRLASGPIGSHVVWRSGCPRMSGGWFVKEMRWSIQETKPAGQPAHAYVQIFSPPTTTINGRQVPLDREPDQFLHGDKEPVWPRKHGLMMRFRDFIMDGTQRHEDPDKHPFNWYLRPIKLELKADVTVVNDHDVILRLDRVTFNGPTGKTFADAFADAPPPAGRITFIMANGTHGVISNLETFTPR